MANARLCYCWVSVVCPSVNIIGRMANVRLLLIGVKLSSYLVANLLSTVAVSMVSGELSIQLYNGYAGSKLNYYPRNKRQTFILPTAVGSRTLFSLLFQGGNSIFITNISIK